MWLLLNWRLWVLVGLLALGPIGYMKGRHDGKRSVQADWQSSVAAANAEARHLEQERQRRSDEAGRLAATREAGIRADADRARGSADGLRDDLDATKRFSQESRAASDATVSALADVFGQCSRAYSELAQEADRATSEALTLRQAWPK